MKAAIITVSTSVAAGDNEDLSGQALAELATEAGAEVVATEVVSDDRAQIEEALRRHSAPDAGTSFIFTTGGTGLTADDVTPEATRAVIDRDAPGIAEAMRAESLKHTPMGLLSQGRVRDRGPDADRQLPRQSEGDPAAVRTARARARARRRDAASRAWSKHPRPLSCAGSLAISASGPRSSRCRSAFRPARRSPCWGATAPASRRCCGSSRRCCARTPEKSCCSASSSLDGHSLFAPGSACSATSRSLYRDLTGRENLRYHADLHRIGHDRVDELLDAVQMRGRAEDPVRTLSRGMVQRLAVCRAVLHRPALLLLDEPRASLDPGAGELIEPLIGRAAGATRVLTSHDPQAALAEADLALGLGTAGRRSSQRQARSRTHSSKELYA